MIPVLFVGNIVVCIVIFLFAINSKFRNRVIQECQVQANKVQTKLLSPSQTKSIKNRKSSDCPTEKPAPSDLFRPSVDDETISVLKSEPGPDSQVGNYYSPANNNSPSTHE